MIRPNYTRTTISIYYAKAFLASAKPTMGCYFTAPDYSSYGTIEQAFDKTFFSLPPTLHVYTSPSFVLNYFCRKNTLVGRFRRVTNLRLFCAAYIQIPKIYNHVFVPLFSSGLHSFSSGLVSEEVSLSSTFFVYDKLIVYNALFFSNFFSNLLTFKANALHQLFIANSLFGF